MTPIRSETARRRSLWLTLGATLVLTSITLTAPALERQPAIDAQPSKSLPSTTQPSKTLPTPPPSFETSPMPVEWQLDQLRARIAQLEAVVAGLQQQGATSNGNLAQRLATLESALQVGPGSLRLQSPGSVEIRSAGGTVILNGSGVDMGVPMVRVQGIVRSNQVITDTVIASSYTPGAGNVW